MTAPADLPMIAPDPFDKWLKWCREECVSRNVTPIVLVGVIEGEEPLEVVLLVREDAPTAGIVRYLRFAANQLETEPIGHT